jgi:hypothetical protein
MRGSRPLRKDLPRGGTEVLLMRGVGPPGQKHEVQELQGGGGANKAAGAR